VLNAIADYNSLRAEPPRIKKDADDDDIMKAINELELGGVETEELETGKVETDKVETGKAKAGSGNAGINKAALLNGLNIVFQELKKSSGQKNLRKLREANMEAVVKADLEETININAYLGEDDA